MDAPGIEVCLEGLQQLQILEEAQGGGRVGRTGGGRKEFRAEGVREERRGEDVKGFKEGKEQTDGWTDRQTDRQTQHCSSVHKI